MKTDPDSIHKKTITIVAPSISISSTMPDGGVALTNATSKDLDLKEWTINAQGLQYLIPPYTIIPSGGTLSISSRMLGFKIGTSSVTLGNPNGVVVSTYQKTHDEPRRAIQTNESSDEDSSSDQSNLLDTVVKGTALTAEAAPVSSPNQTKDSLPDQKETPWYVWAGIGAIAIGIAYGAVRLYATRNSNESDVDFDDLDAEGDFL